MIDRAAKIAGKVGREELRIDRDPIFGQPRAAWNSTNLTRDEVIRVEKIREAADIVGGEESVQGRIAPHCIRTCKRETIHHIHSRDIQALEQPAHQGRVPARLRGTERVQNSVFENIGLIDIGTQHQTGAFAANITEPERCARSQAGLQSYVPVLDICVPHVGVHGVHGLRAIGNRKRGERLGTGRQGKSGVGQVQSIRRSKNLLQTNTRLTARCVIDVTGSNSLVAPSVADPENDRTGAEPLGLR